MAKKTPTTAAPATPVTIAVKPAKAPRARKERAPCPVTLAQFREHAKGLMIQIADDKRLLAPKEFSSGSYGWFSNDKIILTIDGVPCKVQCNLQLILVGSKGTGEGGNDSDGADTNGEAGGT